MSTSSMNKNINRAAAQREEMNEQIVGTIPKHIANTVDLMAYPFAGAAAFSALGFGLASHAFGLWAGVMSGAAEESRRLLTPVLVDLAPRADDFAEGPASPTTRAVAATEALIAGANAPVAVAEPEKELMPEDFRRPKAMDKPEAPDDLKRISGVGPKLEQVLNGLGVWTYGQIACWGREEIAWVDDYLSFTGRIERDGWLAQAAKLASGATKH